MMNQVLVIVIGVLYCLCYAAAQNQELPIRSHSIQPPFIDADLSNRFWEFGGSTVVSTNQYIRLTPDRQSKNGWLWSKMPFNYQHWIVEFEFKVEGQGYRVFGDGFAFWFTKERAETGPIFGNRDRWHGLGIFFDTYANGRHKHTFPYVSAMYNDGQQSYSNDDDNAQNSWGGCEAQFRKVSTPTKARVKYLKGRLTLYLDVKGKNEWDECFSIESVDFSGHHYIGFTGMTGDVADNHDILRVNSYMLSLPPAEQQEYDRMAKQRSPVSIAAQQRQQQQQPAPQQQQQQNQPPSNEQQPPPEQPQQEQVPQDQWKQQIVNKAQTFQETNPRSRGREKVKSEGLTPITYFLIMLVVIFVSGIGYLFFKTQSRKNNKKF